MPPEDQDTRLRDLERAQAVQFETMKGIQTALVEIKQQIQSFLDKAQLALAMEGRVKHVEEENAELFHKAEVLFSNFEGLRNEYTALKTQHEVCINRGTTEKSWWKERFGRLVDAGAIAVIVWFLALYKVH